MHETCSVELSITIHTICPSRGRVHPPIHAQEFRPHGFIDRRGRDKETGKRRGGIRRDRWLHCTVQTADGDAGYLCSNGFLEVR